MIKLGSDTEDGIVDGPNTTTVKNAKFGLKCSPGVVLEGRFGTLKGIKGFIIVNSGCIKSTIP